eukprot:1187393-Pyramimonas_sp.AAC.1
MKPGARLSWRRVRGPRVTPQARTKKKNERIAAAAAQPRTVSGDIGNARRRNLRISAIFETPFISFSMILGKARDSFLLFRLFSGVPQETIRAFRKNSGLHAAGFERFLGGGSIGGRSAKGRRQSMSV